MSSQPESLELLIVTIRIHKCDGDESEDDEQQKTDANNETDVVCNSPMTTTLKGVPEKPQSLMYCNFTTMNFYQNVQKFSTRKLAMSEQCN